MSVNISSIAEKTFNILKGFGFPVDSYDLQGKQVVDPTEATRFVISDPNILVRLDPTTETLVLNTSEDLADHKVRKMLKNLSHDSLMNFDFKIFNKTIKAKGESADIARQAEKDMADVMEGFGSLEGSSKTSYQTLENIKIVVKHKKPVNEEVRGSRSRQIHSIFIQRGDERFKLPENNLQMARAMARHVQKGGEVFDEVGTKIVEMASDLKKLREFVRYVQSAKIVNEENEEYVSLAKENINQIKNSFSKLSGTKTYESAVESLAQLESAEILEDDLDLESKFTVKHFDRRVADVMGTLQNASIRKQAFESYITKAIANESFEGLKNALRENDMIDFATPEAKLGHQVNQLSYTSKDPQLSTYLQGISKKITSGGQLNQFEYGAIKSCLLSANQVRSEYKESNEDLGTNYETFLEKFDIL